MEREIARLRKRIELECEAIHKALAWYTVVTHHRMIIKRFQAIGHCQHELARLLGKREATRVTIETYESAMRRICQPRSPRLSFATLLMQHHVSTITLAHNGGVQRSVTYAMLQGYPVEPEQACKVLDGLRRLCGVAYTLAELDIVLTTGGHSEYT